MPNEEGKESVNWVRGPKEADLSKVPLEKIIKAHEERGIEVDIPTGGKGKSKVIKTVVVGMPSPEDKKNKS
jgi:hypothetical protein